MINLKFSDEIQNIYLFIDVYLYLFVFTFLSMKSELKENQSWATKISLLIPNK